MKILDRAKEAAEQATARAKDELEEVQARKELHSAYGELGKKAAELVDAGALEHPDLAALHAKVKELRAKLGE